MGDITTNKPQQRWSGIIGTGQSLSTGVQGECKGKQPQARFGHRLYDSTRQYKLDAPEASTLSLVPLIEPIRPHGPIDGPYPLNLAGQTPHSAMAAELAALAKDRLGIDLHTVHSAVGESGAPMMQIKKGGSGKAYAAGIFEAKAITRLVKSSLSSEVAEAEAEFPYDAVIMTHGETDSIFSNEGYQNELMEMQQNYAEDLMAITGQKHEPVMILTQMQACPPAGDFISTVIQAQWRVQGLSSNRVICCGPKYQYGYAPGALHLPLGGYNRMGEKYAQAFYQTVVEQRPFLPLAPTALQRVDGRTIKVQMHVPCPPLQWDETIPVRVAKAHPSWGPGRGFEVRDAEKKDIEIESVEINDDGRSVTIHLGCGTYQGPLSVSYAMTCGSNRYTGGLLDGRLGQLCDSDPMVGAGAEELSCTVEKGSREVKCPDVAVGTFQRRACFDIASPGEYVVVAMSEDELGTLRFERPWEGESGVHKLTFRHNHRNFLVSFYGIMTDKDGEEQFPVPLRVN